MASKEKRNFAIPVAIVSTAIISSVMTYLATRKRNTTQEGNNDTSNNKDGAIKLSVPSYGSCRANKFDLDFRGKVDTIYEKHGPKPFQFNREVVSVFDDMISRSVPLYCEVIDLLIYWFEKYYRPGTRAYDLGCSTGTTLDILAKAATQSGEKPCEFIGIDNSEAMVEACKKKLEWVVKKDGFHISIRCADIMDVKLENATFVIINYTLQFVPVIRRQLLLQTIASGLNDGGILLLSEKVRAESSELQETCTWIYEDFKERRNYTRREIARKKEALMNVLIPFTERELREVLNLAGFEDVEIVAKWNNFTTFIARKRKGKENLTKKNKASIMTPHMDTLFDAYPVYLNDYTKEPGLISKICLKRHDYYRNKGGFGMSNDNKKKFDDIAKLILRIPKMKSKRLIVDENELCIGDPDELSQEEMAVFQECINSLKPWKKGPLNLFGTKIDTEWRSDWKWERLQKALLDDDLKDKVICDLGCGNGYFMYRMLSYQPKLVIGMDPNLQAWLEFSLFQRISGVNNLKFEYLRGDVLQSWPQMFDVVFCLGVLYHTPNPIGMLTDIKNSMKKKSILIIDCQGIEGDQHIALFPKKQYANMKGVYFLPTLNTLQNWLRRVNFNSIQVIFSEELSTNEQRSTSWADVRSLKDALDPSDKSMTIEGYPRAHRFYIKCQK